MPAANRLFGQSGNLGEHWPLLNGLNFSLALAGKKVRGSRSDVTALLGSDSSADAKAALDRAVAVFLGGQVAAGTVDTLQKQLDSPQIVQAKLDDPVKQVDLGVVTGSGLARRNFSGDHFGVHMSNHCCEGVRPAKFSRRYFMKQGGIAMVGRAPFLLFCSARLLRHPGQGRSNSLCSSNAEPPTA